MQIPLEYTVHAETLLYQSCFYGEMKNNNGLRYPLASMCSQQQTDEVRRHTWQYNHRTLRYAVVFFALAACTAPRESLILRPDDCGPFTAVAACCPCDVDDAEGCCCFVSDKNKDGS